MERRPITLLIRKQNRNHALEIQNNANMILNQTKINLPKIILYTKTLNLKREEEI